MFRDGRPPPVVLAVGPLPPPINGMSNAFQLLTRHLPSRGWNVSVVDIADRSPPRVGSTFSPARARDLSVALLKALAHCGRADVLYLTIAQSRWGFARDV